VVPAITVAVKVTRVFGGNGAVDELAGNTASVVVVAVCANATVPGTRKAARRRTIRRQRICIARVLRRTQGQKSFILHTPV
jgi:hypothetical protein